jgi:hypothetical protein
MAFKRELRLLWYNVSIELFIHGGLTQMASRTYLPGLRIVLGTAHRFGTRYQSQLSAALTTDQYNCLVSTLAAIASCLTLLGVELPS